MEQPHYRPPSESGSLLIRVVRNCSWNKCTFCKMYKGKTFSRRTVSEVLEDIHQARRVRDLVQDGMERGLSPEAMARCLAEQEGLDLFYLPWAFQPVRHVFLGDSNALVLKTASLADILRELKDNFPELERVTSYARMRTLKRKTPAELRELQEAGLVRVHVGLETGHSRFLQLIHKGAAPEDFMHAGRLLRDAGLSLSLYVIQGLVGKEGSLEHARETARVINQAQPDFVRLRTLHLERGTPLADAFQRGELTPCDRRTLLLEERELLLNLMGPCRLVSDHYTNLLPLKGSIPQDKERLLQEVGAALLQEE